MPDTDPIGDDTAAAMSMLTDHANSHAGEHAGGLRQSMAEALAAAFTRPIPRMVKGRITDEIADPHPADRVDRTMSVQFIAGDGDPAFRMVTCNEAAEVCAAVRDDKLVAALESIDDLNDLIRQERVIHIETIRHAEQAWAAITRVREFAEQVSQGRSRVVSRDFLTPMLIRLLEGPPATPKEHPDASPAPVELAAAREELTASERRRDVYAQKARDAETAVETLTETLADVRRQWQDLRERLAEETWKREQAEAALTHIRGLADILTGIREGLEATYGEHAAHSVHAFERSLRRALDEAGVSEEQTGGGEQAPTTSQQLPDLGATTTEEAP